jgi:hypothetical protein
VIPKSYPSSARKRERDVDAYLILVSDLIKSEKNQIESIERKSPIKKSIDGKRGEFSCRKFKKLNKFSTNWKALNKNALQ